MSDITAVLIVGGGPAGLTAAGLLTIQGVKCILLEKHEKVSLHPRAVGFTTRTMEIFDILGVADQVPQTTADFRLRRIQIESLAGKWGDELGGRPGGNKPAGGGGGPTMLDYSPYLGAAIAQDKLDVILRRRVQELGCDIRYGHRMLSFSTPKEGDNESPVNVQIRHPSGKEYTLHAQYVLAADGHKSTIREGLGIKMTGRGDISTIQSILFKAPSLDKYLERGFRQFAIHKPETGFRGFLTTYNDSRWVLMAQDGKTRPEKELREAILDATGIPDLDYEFVTTGLWNLSARVADSFCHPPLPSDGGPPRFFLLGDAAHTLPPTRGGYGANTGIADAHNIAWKLASVLSGRSRPTLLQSYDVERRQVAWLRHQQIFAGPDYTPYRREGEDYGPVIDSVAMELGQVYQSSTIIVDENDNNNPLALRPDELNGRPGSRAPHIWLSQNGSKTSTLTLYANTWTLVTTNQKWLPATIAASHKLDFPINILCPGINGVSEIHDGEIAAKFGLLGPDDGNDNNDTGGGGASLVRPDGFVCWRGGASKDETQATRDLIGAVEMAACIQQT